MPVPQIQGVKSSVQGPAGHSSRPAGALLQRKCACGGAAGLTGECETCRGEKLQRRSLAVNTPGDRFEQEADRVADAVVSDRGQAALFSLSTVPIARVQREDAPKEKTDEEKYKEGAAKLGEAFLETPLGKDLLEKVKQDKLVKGATEAGKSFIGTLPGKIITGAAAAGAVATLAAMHKELPAQIPEIPLDVLTPGLSVQIAYKGPVDKPTEAMITFKFAEQAPKGGGEKKPGMTATDQYRAETARIAADQAKFRAGMRYPPGSPEDLQQKAEAAAAKSALAKYAPGPDLDAMIKKYPWLGTQPPKGGPQLTLPTPSFGYKPPSLLGDEYKLELPGEQKKKEDEPALQRKLAVGASNDPLEQEADRIADQVLAAPAHSAVSEAPPHIQRYAGQATGQTETVPASVDRVLASPGRPLEPALRQDMEQRFGHDFSQVRVHTGGAVEQSVRDVNANAYAVGKNVVFGAGQFAPSTYQGRRLIAHELTHVVQQSGSDGLSVEQGNKRRSSAPISSAAAGRRLIAHELEHIAQPGAAGVVRRDIVMDRANNITAFEFRVGHELTEAFVNQAKQLSADGKLDNADIAKLEADIISARDTVSDHERMFIAGLIDAGNVRKLQALRVNATAKITFQFTTITDVRMKKVIDTGQPAMPVSVSKPFNKMTAAVGALDISEALKQGNQAVAAAETEIRSLVGASLNAKIGPVIAFAQAHGILVFNLLVAMQQAASDNAANDRLLAAAAYATAAAAGVPLADDLLKGKVRVDALAAAKFSALPGVSAGIRALYVPAAPINPLIAGLKGDTVYMPDDFDIADLYDRSNVIHELRHAQDDKAGPAPGRPSSGLRKDLEATAYRAQARYILDQMSGQNAAAQATSATRVGTTSGDLVLMAVLVEAQSDPAKYQPLAVQLFAAATTGSRLTPTQVAALLARTPAQLESLLQRLIQLLPGMTPTASATLDGLSGESLIHWIHRL